MTDKSPAIPIKTTLLDDDDRRKIGAVLEAESATFSILTAVAGLNPEHDFRFANLSGVNFSGADLRNYDFTGANLSFTRWKGAIWDHSTIVVNADFLGALGPHPQPPTFSSQVTGALPILRRFGLLLIGDQARADDILASALTSLGAAPRMLSDEAAPRHGKLFRQFTRLALLNLASTNGDHQSTKKFLGKMQPLSRAAFLLTSLEKFSVEDTAYILDINKDQVHRLLNQAGTELAVAAATNVLIIEDEDFIAEDLASLMENLGHRVVGIARTEQEALKLATENDLGLVIADIQLADGSSGLNAVLRIVSSQKVGVIFVTAYPERFLTGPRPEPAMLVAKPFQPAMVQALASHLSLFERFAKLKTPE